MVLAAAAGPCKRVGAPRMVAVRQGMKWIDLPPIWLAACLVLAWGGTRVFGALWHGGLPLFLGLFLVAAGILLMVGAVLAFSKARTTVIPHQQPSTLVDHGILRHSRNPIYLGDVLVLLGMSLIWGSLIGLALVPLLAVILQRRFIIPEEARLAAAFPEAFAAYQSQTRRWL